jgi:MoxR-like ATPase
VVLDNLWMGPEEANALATALQPKLSKAQASLKSLLQDAVTLEVAIEAGCDAVVLANLMPRYWASFIRNSPLEEVRPIGTTKLGGRP